MFNEDLDFVIAGSMSDDAEIVIEVWDRFWINDFKVSNYVR